MKEPGEGLLHGVHLVPAAGPDDQAAGAGRQGSRHHAVSGGVVTCDDAGEALAALCIAVRHARLRAAWGLHPGDPPTLDITAGETHPQIDRLIETVRRDLPGVVIRRHPGRATGGSGAGTSVASAPASAPAAAPTSARVPGPDALQSSRGDAPPVAAPPSAPPRQVPPVADDVAPPRPRDNGRIEHGGDDHARDTDDEDLRRGEGDGLCPAEIDMLLGRGDEAGAGGKSR